MRSTVERSQVAKERLCKNASEAWLSRVRLSYYVRWLANHRDSKIDQHLHRGGEDGDSDHENEARDPPVDGVEERIFPKLGEFRLYDILYTTGGRGFLFRHSKNLP